MVNNKDKSSKLNDISILDCTFRDGGYYTNWNFDKNLINKYLKICNQGLCEIVELGLRTSGSGQYLGPHAYTCSEYFEICRNYQSLKYSVLVNWKDISQNNNPEKLFKENASDDIVDIVRIAVKVKKLKDTEQFINEIKSRGYKVSLNIQNCDSLFEEKLIELEDIISDLNIDILYLADTNGFLDPNQVEKLVSDLVSFIKIPIGVHTHNNKGLAFANSLAALNNGAKYVDSTFTGIGRGPGNTQTEYISNHLKKLPIKLNTELSDLINSYFYPLKNKKNWGDNLYFYLSGLSNQSASLMHEKLTMNNYDNECLVEIACSDQKDPISNYELSNNKINNFIVKKYTAAVFANSHSWQVEKKQILDYLKNNKIKSYHINFPDINNYISDIDFFCSCDPLRVKTQFSKYKNFKEKSLICDVEACKKLNLKIEQLETENFKYKVKENNLLIEEESCVIPYLQSLCYCLCYLYSKGHRNILLIGVEGYKESIKNIQIISCLNILKKNYKDIDLITLNKNVLGIKSKSIFEFLTSI